MARGRAAALTCAAVAVTTASCGSGSGLPDTWVEPNTGMSFVLVDSGSFTMGLRPDEPGDLRPAPIHDVRISTPFYLGRFEVTQKEWLQVMADRPSQFPDCGEQCPVETVTWVEVQEFLRRLQAMDPGQRFRLPTEAEWEYACRAGTDLRYGVADTLSPELANYDARIPFDAVTGEAFVGHPLPVGSYPPNPWGISDLQGNVWEWSQDEYCPYATGSVTDPRQSCGTDTIAIRGGSWYFSANAARCGRRYTHDRHDKGFSLGFRVVREAPER
jgi:formylglycine-generating enzyme required for sulfatase activity